MPPNIITEGSITTWNQITVSMSLVGGQSFDACCKPSFLLIIFSSWDFSAPIIYVCKRNQTEQNGSVRFLMPSFDPLCPFPMTQWMPWPNAFTGIGIALSFRLSVQCHTFPLHVSYEPFVRISHYSEVKWASSHINSFVSRVFHQQFVCGDFKGDIKSLHHWPFVRGNHWWPMNFPHNGPIRREAFLCNAVILRRLPPILNSVQDQKRIQLISIRKRYVHF